VEGPDDFGSMSEIIYRRYKRLKEEEQDLPQLIVIDGGKGQLNAAVKSLKELNLYGKIGIIGIAKRLEEIFFPGDSIPLYLDKNSSSLKLIQQVRNESHRFGLLFHRQLRSKNFIQSDLSNIKGVGEKTIKKLIAKFGSVEQLKKASYDEIYDCIGKKNQAENIVDYFKKK
jgi:excinuclease ABC subunit C